jgi:large subunit ribosomal protein L27
MAHRKAQGSTRNLRDSNPQFLGVKAYDGEKVKPGSIIIRQRGTKVVAGKGVAMGSDHTIFAIQEGVVKFGQKRKQNFDGSTSVTKTVSVA